MKISLFDKNEYDDILAYSRYGKVSVHTRFSGAKAKDADVIITTFSRPPDIDGTIINMASTDTRHLSHIKKARIIQSKQWNVDAVAHFTVRIIIGLLPAQDRKGIAILGYGKIGRRVHNILLHKGFDSRVFGIFHYGDLVKYDKLQSMGEYEILTVHMKQTDENVGCLDGLIPHLSGTTIVNTARRGLLSNQALLDGIRRGNVANAVLDGGNPFPHKKVEVTPHIAWKGESSKILRPYRILKLLRKLKETT